MKVFQFAVLFCATVCPELIAGSINVVHLGPTDVMKFEIRAGDATQDFTLPHGSDSGPFVLPDKPAAIKSFGEDIPSLEIPVSKNPRIALLIPGEEGFEWRLQEAKPSQEKWAFRIVNLAAEPAEAKSSDALLHVPGKGEISLDVSKKSQLNLQIADSVDLAYEGTEPRAVVAFIYREDGRWKAILLPDR